MSFIISHPILSETYLDGFGNTQQNPIARQKWAGIQTRCNEQICENQWISSQHPHELTNYFGQKSIISNEEPAMIMAIVHDEFGNLSSTNGDVQFQWQSHTEFLSARNQHGIIARIIPPQTTIGEFWSSAQMGNIQSERQFYRVIPQQEPLTFPKELAEITDLDNDRQFLLPPPVNSLGENLSLGSIGQLIGKSANHEFYIQPITSYQSQISAQIPFHALNKSYEYSLQFGRNQSEIFSLPYENPKISPPLSLNIQNFPEISSVKLILNDLRTSEGYLIDDGEAFTVKILNQQNQSYELSAQSINGNLEFFLPQSWARAQFHITLVHEWSILPLEIDLSETGKPRIKAGDRP